METIVVQPSNDEELKLLKEFLQKSRIKNRVLNEEDKEDLVLGLMMQETDYSDIIDTNEFIKQLQGKWNIIVTKHFAKDVDKELNEQQKQQLAQILISITQSKTLSEISDCKKLKGFKNAYRIRMGNYRIGFLFEDETVKLSRVLNRKDVYKYFPWFIL